jgi:hypothetical protein
MHTHDNDNAAAMNQMIFKIGLPVGTVSVYLLCCSLADAGKRITTGNLLEIWNGTKEALNESLTDFRPVVNGRNNTLKGCAPIEMLEQWNNGFPGNRICVTSCALRVIIGIINFLNPQPVTRNP